MTAQHNTRDRVIQLFLDQRSPNYEVDYEKVAEALGYSSLQMIAFLKSLNAEFGTNISLEDVENARGKGGILSLLA